MNISNKQSRCPTQHTCVWKEKSLLGEVGIAESQGRITHLFLPNDPVPTHFMQQETQLLREAFVQLHAYLNGSRRRFTVMLAPGGTPFMRRVWACVAAVPYGCTASYGQIAHQVGNPGAMRAVGMANHKNPIPIFIPCHRIIGADGTLTGYGGGLALKARLLDLEQAVGKRNRGDE